MPKFLALASYTSEGIKGLTRAGGTARRAVADKLLKSLGGRLEGFYFAFGENDAYVIFEVPDNSSAAAISLAVTGTGVIPHEDGRAPHARRDGSGYEKVGPLRAAGVGSPGGRQGPRSTDRGRRKRLV